MSKEIVISFPDSSESFAYGVEFGRLLQKMEDGLDVIDNNGFPVRLENKKLLEDTCNRYNYIPVFGSEHFGEWIEFMGLKKSSAWQN